MTLVEGPFVKPRGQQLSRHSWRGEAPEAGTAGPWERGELCWWARVRLDTADGEETKIFSANSPEAATAAARAWITGHPRATAPAITTDTDADTDTDAPAPDTTAPAATA